MKFQSLTLCSLVLTAPFAWGITVPIAARSTVLSNGNGTNIYGHLSNGWGWTSTGVLTEGCSSSSKYPISIKDCYSLSLTSDPTKELDDRHLSQPRQRIEFSTPYEADGTSHTYKWKFYLSSKTGTSKSFFHLMQILAESGNEYNGPMITLDAIEDKIAIRCVSGGCKSSGSYPSIALSDYTDKTTEHTMSVTYGPKGKLDYVITDADTGDKLLSYSASGQIGSKKTNVHFGTYRAAVKGMTVALADVGDFSGN